MRSHDIYSACAVAIPVSLGLGLIYLYAMGRIEFGFAFVVLLATVALLPLLAVLGRRADLDEVMGRSHGRHRRRDGPQDPDGPGGSAQP